MLGVSEAGGTEITVHEAERTRLMTERAGFTRSTTAVGAAPFLPSYDAADVGDAHQHDEREQQDEADRMHCRLDLR